MNQIKAGVVLNYVTLGLNNLVGLLYIPYMLRMLGQTQYGLYSLAASIIAYLTLMDMGFGNAIIRYTAKLRAERKQDEQYSMFGMFIILYSVIGLISLIVGFVLYFNVDGMFGRTMDGEELRIVRIILLLLLFNLAVSFPLGIFGGIMSAYERFVFPKVVSICRIALNTLVMIALLAMGYKAITMVVVQTAFNIASLVLNTWYCFHKIGIRVKFTRWDFGFLKEIMVYSFWILLNAVMDRLYWSTGQFVLGATVSAVAIAVFALAIQLETMYMSFSTAISGVFLPRVTAMVTKNCNNKEVSDLFIRTGRLQYIVLAFILTGFIIFGREFVILWGGLDYAGSYPIALLFMGVLTVPLIQNLGITILQARNQMKFRSQLYIVIALASLAGQIILAQYYGAMGCAVAIAAALFLGQGLILNIYYHRVQKIDIVRFWKEIIAMSLAPGLLCLAALYLKSLYGLHGWLQLGIAIALYTIVYLPVCYYFSINSYEKNLVVDILRRLFPCKTITQ